MTSSILQGERATVRRPAAPEADSGFRPDIQGVRALAVALVVGYHLSPGLIPGGFVGVDVFFVVSGFLISGHLARTLARTGRVDVVDFYARRVRRLMPAAVLVLVVTWLGSLLVLPTTRLVDTAQQVRASAVYLQNWLLAADSVAYLKSDDAASPVQHFWSLSVEEQFYLAWPLLFVLAGVIAFRLSLRPGTRSVRGTRMAAGRRAALVLAVAVVVVSLTVSVRATATNASAAYFVTPTRVWELALGGVLALLPTWLTDRVARVGLLGWAGLVIVIGSAFVLDGSAAFPGAVALWPVGGAVLLLAAGSSKASRGPARVLSAGPAVALGDISYSLYLWHWPLIVFWMTWTGRPVGLLDGASLVLVALLLSTATKRYVEDAVRTSPLFRGSTRRSMALLLAVVLPVALTTVWLGGRPTTSAVSADASHPGAAVLAGDATAPPGIEAIPGLERAQHDYGAYGSGPGGCQSEQADAAETLCYFGDTTHPTKTVALVGDSVAATWFDDLAAMAQERHWRLVTDLHSLCPWSATMANTPYTASSPYVSCHTWGQRVLQTMITDVRPDVVVTSARPVVGTPAHPEAGPAAFAELGEGMAAYWRELERRGIQVVGVREPPEMGFDVPDCLSKPGSRPEDCSAPARTAILDDTPVLVAARALGHAVTLIDLNRYICGPQVCEAIVGNVVVYIDRHHLTTTYASTIRPYFEERLLAVPGL